MTKRTINVKKSDDVEVDIVEALVQRAERCVGAALARKRQSSIAEDQENYGPDPKPFDLWEAKLCLEIARLFQQVDENGD